MNIKTYLGLGFSSLLIITASGCSTFQPMTFNQLGNFSTYQLNEQTFRVSAKTSPNMSYGTTQEITLVKAAQITLQHGFTSFKILNDPSSTNQPPRQAIVYTAPPPVFHPYGFYGPRSALFWNGPLDDFTQVVNIEPNEVAYSIICYKNTQNMPNDAFNATLILKSLGAKYGVAENGDILKPDVKKTS
ncbi:hypothetical protein I2F27_00680 [Acinetobacter sp. B5B]|uniref:CC0125/CC1285 family lipoprotein n=1 Tax=Acinetobacter baretiae TaxID=2605383 RepID=UPI0018C1EFDF|nr:hypothetical protein [Acinetobacter baretiae]MBF7681852.1 hypothetical protein [Acinetobacter baretiae]MBF7686215.1 hypothetical protein [Acinetobacter baretiae]